MVSWDALDRHDCSRTDELSDLVVLLDLLVESLNVLGEGVEVLWRLFQSSEVGRGGIGTGERVELDRGLSRQSCCNDEHCVSQWPG